MSGPGFRPVTGVHSAADLVPASSEILLLCIFPAMIWDNVSAGQDRLGQLLTALATGSLLVLGWRLVRRSVARRRWKPGTTGVVLVDPGRSRRRVRAELCGSLGVDPDKARQALRYPGTLLVRDID